MAQQKRFVGLARPISIYIEPSHVRLDVGDVLTPKYVNRHTAGTPEKCRQRHDNVAPDRSSNAYRTTS